MTDTRPHTEAVMSGTNIRGVSWGGGALGAAAPRVTKGGAKKKRRKRKGKERKEKRGKEREKERRRQKREKIERLINITRRAPFRGGLKVGAGSAPPYFFILFIYLFIFCRDRAPQRKNA